MSGGFRSGSSCWRFLLHGSRGRPSGFFGPTSCTTLLTGPSIHFSHPGEFQTCSRGDEMCNSARLNVFLFRLIPIAVRIQVVKGMARQHNSRGNETLLASVEGVKIQPPAWAGGCTGMGQSGLEPPTSPLSGVRSSQLSY